MQFSISAVLALAMTATATKMTMSQAQGQCTQGDIACCDSKEVVSGDGILGNLLAKGALNGLLGNDDAACAKVDVLGDVNVLGMISPTQFSRCYAQYSNISQLMPSTPRLAPSARPSLPAAPRAETR